MGGIAPPWLNLIPMRGIPTPCQISSQGGPFRSPAKYEAHTEFLHCDFLAQSCQYSVDSREHRLWLGPAAHLNFITNGKRFSTCWGRPRRRFLFIDTGRVSNTCAHNMYSKHAQNRHLCKRLSLASVSYCGSVDCQEGMIHKTVSQLALPRRGSCLCLRIPHLHSIQSDCRHEVGDQCRFEL